MSLKLVDKLFIKPRREKGIDAAKFYGYKPNIYHQADLLFLPNDKGYKYLLVVVCLGSKKVDMEPLKNKQSANIIKSFRKIYNRGILKYPKNMMFDAGTEFKGNVAKFFIEKDIRLKIARKYRHRQQGMVERRNQIIGRYLFKKMIAEELATNTDNGEWVDNLGKLKRRMNRQAKKKVVKNEYNYSKWSGDLLSIGDTVRIALDTPMTTDKKRLNGRFRSHDMRWGTTTHIITDMELKPDQPPFYIIDNDKSIKYTKGQLQLVNKNEKKPKAKKRDKPQNYFVVDKILNHKIRNGKTYFLVKWKGYKKSDSTWEPKKQLLKDVPRIVNRYEKNI